MKKLRLFLSLAAISASLLATIAYSDTIVRGTKSAGGTDFSSGAVIKSSEVNTDFNTIYSDYNGNISNANIKSGANIDKSKLSGYPFTYVDLSAGTIRDTEISASAGIQGSKVTGVVHTTGEETIADTKIFSTPIEYSSSDTSLITEDAMLVTKKYADGIAVSAGAYPGSYPIVNADLGSNCVTSNKINDGTITDSDLADGAVKTAKLADSSVTETKLNLTAGSISGTKLTDNTVTETKLVAGTITDASISATANIVKTKLSGYPFTSADITDGVITDTDLAGGISSSKLTAGANCTASGTRAFAVGNTNTASGTSSFAIGHYSSAYLPDQFALASERNGSTTGSGQYSIVTVNGFTTDNTPTELTIGSLGTISGGVFIPASRAWGFNVMIVGRCYQGTGLDNCAAYEIKGLIKRDASNNTALVGTITKTVIAEDDATWDATVTADDTNEKLQIIVTGANSRSITWNATIQLTENGY